MEKDEFRVWMDRLREHKYSRLGELLGVDPETIGRWNRGETPIPRWVRLAFAAKHHRLDEVYGPVTE